ncbi:hypothetical protein [Glaciimonas sp. PCH181]|uniref:hypothetical protein n=1 Tax=Glaciimonas sp. PCH181 TaxID=2133943 RepID=UPI000D3575AE|nr:hypothetical protein [Glaciimonas sp. PCH181]PUA17032.1 hypothetical protein C7W93_13800 [Glaciimonas sp. PCH181]
MFNNKSALLMLAVSSLTALLVLSKQRLARAQADQSSQKKALTTWEGEGGNLPGKPVEPR